MGCDMSNHRQEGLATCLPPTLCDQGLLSSSLTEIRPHPFALFTAEVCSVFLAYSSGASFLRVSWVS